MFVSCHRWLNHDEPTSGEVRRAKARAVGGKRPRCQKGTACSAACIDPNKSCLVTFPEVLSPEINKLRVAATTSIPKVDPKSSRPLPKMNENQFEEELYSTVKQTKELNDDSKKVSKLLGVSSRWRGRLSDHFDSDREVEEFKVLRKTFNGNLSDSIVALNTYTSDAKFSWAIRQAQRNEENKGKQAEKWAKDLQKLLDWGELPRSDVVKYRGFRVSPETLEELIKTSNLKENYSPKTINSWSFSLEIAREFSKVEIEESPEKTEKIIFRTVNTKGVPIEYVSQIPNEYEILTPAKVSYKHTDYNLIEDENGDTLHIFDVEEF